MNGSALVRLQFLLFRNQPNALLVWLLFPLALSILVVFVQPIYLLAILTILIALILCLVCVKSPHLCLYLYLATALAIPPIYPDALGGEIPVYASSFFLLIGGLILLIRSEEFKIQPDVIGKSSLCFLVAIALSLPFGFWLSGTSTGFQSCLRFFLILQPFLVYVWIRGFALITDDRDLSVFIKLLLGIGLMAAVYGIVDFYFPIPIPHPFAEQFIYLKGERIRRAQGLFYEASSFGNMCAFFLGLSLTAAYSKRQRESIIHLLMSYLLIGIFTTALFLSYSRGAWANVLVTVVLLLLLQPKNTARLLGMISFLMGGFVFLIYQISPEVVLNFFDWRLGALSEIWSDPNFATSGRWETWGKLIDFFADHPWLLLFGIGYKTLALSPLFGESLITDNGFMSILFETGILGLGAFLWLTAVLLHSLLQWAREASHETRTYAAFMFAFWCGEMVQMLTGDIFTYWRNMIIFFALIAAIQQSARHQEYLL